MVKRTGIVGRQQALEAAVDLGDVAALGTACQEEARLVAGQWYSSQGRRGRGTLFVVRCWRSWKCRER